MTMATLTLTWYWPTSPTTLLWFSFTKVWPILPQSGNPYQPSSHLLRVRRPVWLRQKKYLVSLRDFSQLHPSWQIHNLHSACSYAAGHCLHMPSFKRSQYLPCLILSCKASMRSLNDGMADMRAPAPTWLPNSNRVSYKHVRMAITALEVFVKKPFPTRNIQTVNKRTTHQAAWPILTPRLFNLVSTPMPPPWHSSPRQKALRTVFLWRSRLCPGRYRMHS